MVVYISAAYFFCQDHKDVVSCVTFNWNDTSIASGSVNGDILLHNVISGQASDPLRLVKTQVFYVQLLNSKL